ncbi:TPA: WecB/TagA/CpsF family glycosyltransferase [Bacillus tropicus]|uniref:WecB/TagA/CpsF family glycosyltransferase n=1 Tax=Bacillus cereus group TaxID=86661 RepID=UPI00003CB5DA|nr:MULTISPECIES: WecB/TagA/CpsF family glycosyltransferase [Bacillus cereus group]AIY73031.1 glycosyltransferase, WecB/TagA/CpsF family protein [Bacillus cereus]AJI08038.1 glycosyltransferase, WecB/TagA/CpsF family protein [Bacillus cereus G9241]EAL15989.1 glycosyl transferase, WecB/TagA/CpsF family [Bacillus cereus G9241]QPS53467.1 WecB/TagA/CpsF family glycosyltransferase [Bacillus tropicus]
MKEKLIGDIKVNVTNEIETMKYLDKQIDTDQKTKIFFLNAHCYNIAQKDSIYKSHLNSAELVLNDGIGIDIGAKLYGFRFQKNMNGTDFIPQLLKHAEKKGYTVYLLGGVSGVAEKARDVFVDNLKGLNIVGARDGYFVDNELEVIEDINKKKPNIVLVAMGVPLQETWISMRINEIDADVFIGVGAFLDFASKKIERAPRWMRKYKLEWLFRLLLEPRRMFKRYVLGIPMFFYYIIKQKNIKF